MYAVKVWEGYKNARNKINVYIIVEGNNFKNPDGVSVGYCKIPSYSPTSARVGGLNIRRKTLKTRFRPRNTLHGEVAITVMHREYGVLNYCEGIVS